ncbi:HNH endonuclease [Coprobacillus sp. AM37-9BH]|nr:HNH endonuclease [Coprobacillus sp. AM37-9BH]
MENIYFRKIVKSNKTNKDGYLFFNIEKKVISKTFTKSNISQKIDNNYYITGMNDKYINFYKQLLCYFKEDNKLNKPVDMKYNNENQIKVKIIQNMKNKQLQLNISSNTLTLPGYKMAQNISDITYDDLINICNEYCLEFNFESNEITPINISNYENVVDIESISDIFDYLTDTEKKLIFPSKIELNIPKTKGKRINYEKELEDSLNGEESFKKVYYKTRNQTLQKKFRERLIAESTNINGTTYCAICNKAYPAAFLIASHIIPVRKIKENKKITNDEIFSKNNGLLLCPNHDLLIDKELISFDDDFNIVVGNIDLNTLKLFGLTEQYNLPEKYRNKERKINFKFHKNDMEFSKFIKN